MESIESESRVKALMQRKVQQIASNGAIKAPISLRLGVVAVATLDSIAELTGETRSSLAASLLNAAVLDAADALGFPKPNTTEFLEQVKPALDKLLAKHDEEMMERGE